MFINIISMTMTTISISEETKERLNDAGKKGDTYEDIVSRLLNLWEDQEK